MQLRIVFTSETGKLYSSYSSRMQEKKKAHTTQLDRYSFMLYECMHVQCRIHFTNMHCELKD